jgi:hypothetical protein
VIVIECGAAAIAAVRYGIILCFGLFCLVRLFR